MASYDPERGGSVDFPLTKQLVFGLNASFYESIWYGKVIGHLLTEAGTDEMLPGGFTGYTYFHDYSSTLQATETGFLFVWKSFYRGINACNTALEYLPTSPLSASQKAIREGEIRFLRAFYYYHLTETFGDIPLRTKATDAPETTVIRNPKDDIYKLIFSDLETALTQLKGVVTPQGGRITEPAVAALLVRLYLTRDINTEALTMADRVINNYSYKLMSDYKALWNISNSDGSKNSEVVWYANDPTSLATGMKLGDTAVVVSKKAISAEYRKSKPYVIYDVNDNHQADGLPTIPRWHFPALIKFADPTRSARDVINSKRDAFVFRLSEMYLIAAEASMKLGDNTKAANYMNVVRSRAALPGQTSAMQVKASDMTLDFILDERAREFVGEQLRWFDLKRTGKLIERATKYNPFASPNIKAYHGLRPIPRVEIDVLQNKSEFLQNPGYN